MMPPELKALKEALEPVFADQREFDQHFRDLDHAEAGVKCRQTYELAMRAVTEISELVNWLGYKPHREHSGYEPFKSAIAEEVVDVFKYLVGICLIWRIDPHMFVDTLFNKNMVVEQRWRQAFGRPYSADMYPGGIVAVDIDGVLADYFTDFNAYVEVKTGRKLKEKELEAPDFFASFLKLLSSEEIDQLKRDFRESGRVATLLPYRYAAAMMQELRNLGCYILLISARPVKEFPRLWPDTLAWLKNNKIEFDALHWETNKAHALSLHRHKVRLAIEDDPRHAVSIANVGVNVLMLRRPYNKEVSAGVNLITAEEWTTHADPALVVRQLREFMPKMVAQP